MTQEKITEQVNFYTEKASSAVQKLGIAGIAIIWLFREVTEQKISISESLVSALMFFVVSIALNILSYIKMSIVYGIYSLYDDDKEVNEVWTIFSWILFLGQFITLVIGFIKLYGHVNTSVLH